MRQAHNSQCVGEGLGAVVSVEVWGINSLKSHQGNEILNDDSHSVSLDVAVIHSELLFRKQNKTTASDKIFSCHHVNEIKTQYYGVQVFKRFV